VQVEVKVKSRPGPEDRRPEAKNLEPRTMNSTRILAELDQLDETIRLVADAERLAAKPGERWRLISELVTVEAMLSRLRQRMLEAVLADVLWQYADGASGNRGAAARELLVQLAAVKEA
jgi:hypothetical protein